ncbi:TIR domain-containing protein [Bradyrhizobium tropiciagri]|uniref:toll/interleukin-1 receptor domain-containing protein n=1 Tax=Bradyrhizobium tropiciagri TaxID=312253 RepID=UPI001BAC4432|nr:TIR domain-containing protein [Bradyrhizobium tropiciagri]MBR0900281.1 TIR domain-containing protein [Bradyrhizobium tropiciagri]
MSDVFISYSKSRQKETKELAADIEARGFNVWWDTDMSPGEPFQDVISNELARARAVVVIWTPTSVASNWVKSEAGRALKRNVLIPVYTPDLNLDLIPPPFDVLHTELVTNRDAIFGALERLGIRPGETPLKPQPAPPSRRYALALVGASAAACALAAIPLLKGRVSGSDKPVRTFEIGSNTISAIVYTFAGNGILLGDWDGAISLRDIQNGSEVRRFDGHSHVVWSLAVLPDSHRIISGGDDGLLRLWDLANVHPIREFKGHSDEVWSVSLLAGQDKVLSASLDGTMKLWDLSTDIPIRTFNYGSRLLCAATTPDGKIAVSGANGAIQMWNVADGSRINVLKGFDGEITSVGALPDGKHVISAGVDGVIRLWELASTQEVAKFGANRKISAFGISPSGRTVIAGGEDAIVQLWNIRERRLMKSFNGHAAAVESVAISPDGRSAASGDRKSVVNIWNLEGTEWGI